MSLSARERDDYLAKIQQAETMAAQFAPGSFENESWLRIAQGYRELIEDAGPGEDPSSPKP